MSLTVNNNDDRLFGGQAWVDNIAEKDSRPIFIVTPSFFKVKGKNKQVLRIVQASESIPTDRESVYWLNLQDIPPLLDGSGLTIALRTRVKLFYRPPSLISGRKNAEEKITLQRRPGVTVLVNSTPYIFAIGSLLDVKRMPLTLPNDSMQKLLMFMPGDEVVVTGLNVSEVSSLDDFGNLGIYKIKNIHGN